MHEVVGSMPGKYRRDFFNSHIGTFFLSIGNHKLTSSAKGSVRVLLTKTHPRSSLAVALSNKFRNPGIHMYLLSLSWTSLTSVKENEHKSESLIRLEAR